MAYQPPPPPEILQVLSERLDSIQITGAPSTRRSLFAPIVGRFVDGFGRDEPDSPSERYRRLHQLQQEIDGLGIFHSPAQFSLVRASAAPTAPLVLLVQLRELSRFRAKVSTDVGNSEGSLHGSLLWRNVLGGAEALSLDYNAGTRTRSAYTATLSRPVPSPFSLPSSSSSSSAIAEAGAHSSTNAKPWARCDEVSRGGFTRLTWGGGSGGTHVVEYAAAWRQVTGLERGASRSVRLEAGDSVKSAVRYGYARDRRDHPRIPSTGHVVRAAVEVAGLGPLGGDVGFARGEVELAAAAAPWAAAAARGGPALTGGLRAGLLCPLPVGFSAGFRPSRLPDRFQLGGPLDVRGFRVGGLGPHDGEDALGGDLFAAVNVGLSLPVPYRGPDSALRVQIFANSGRLVALSPPPRPSSPSLSIGGGGGGGGMTAGEVGSALARALRELVGGGPPSVAAGIGLVYGHPAARFELNFSLPLVVRRGEQARKGLQVGFGIDFL